MPEPRLWAGRRPPGFDGLFLWLDGAGEPWVDATGPFPRAVASGVASADAADVPAEAVAERRATVADLVADVPAGSGLRVDTAPNERTLPPEVVDSLRGEQPPGPDDAGVRVGVPPEHLNPLVDEARTAAAGAGARKAGAVWLRTPDGRCGLLVDVAAQGTAPATDAQLDAVLSVVERHAPREKVRIVSSSDLPGGRRSRWSAFWKGRYRA